MVFPVVMYGCESWTRKKAECRRIDAFELWCWRRLLRVPWTARRSNQSILKEIQPVHPKRDQSWVFIGRTDAEAETPILWPPDMKNWLVGKSPDAGKDWRQQEKGTTEDKMVGWHHQLYGHESEQAPGAVDGQGSQACCSPWGHKVRHDWETELNCGSEVCFFSAFYCFFIHLSWGSFFSHMIKADLPLTHPDSDWGNCLWGVKLAGANTKAHSKHCRSRELSLKNTPYHPSNYVLHKRELT